MAVSRERLLKVAELSAKIFDQNFNPSGVRTGSQILAKRLKGPTVAGYYGDPDLLKFRHLRTLYPGFKFADLDEEYRLTMLEARKRRGKGAPKKKKEASSGSGKAKKRK
ncbi:mitochondral 37S ribosomal protein S27 [Zygosaccharomyces mellis]|uniref:Small ribosomal subunit protein mS33 n=1 Tax=Zygosaccharomyces mellis TaxID=42258 RepID=A0A4C2E4S0_9SACH|nr:mitochondral 37S ribosomal protein S27 [Zygosaccharomyces mellis]